MTCGAANREVYYHRYGDPGAPTARGLDPRTHEALLSRNAMLGGRLAYGAVSTADIDWGQPCSTPGSAVQIPRYGRLNPSKGEMKILCPEAPCWEVGLPMVAAGYVSYKMGPPMFYPRKRGADPGMVARTRARYGRPNPSKVSMRAHWHTATNSQLSSGHVGFYETYV
jgi:hypothetical protein